MKIIKLIAENVKRLTAVEITPEGTLITVGGKNGAGKSSVLDAIAYALGGQALVPAEPIRQGEAEARIEVDLGDIVVVRRFKRDHLPCTCELFEKTKEHHESCGSFRFGPTNSSLVVVNKDGARYPSPQAMLDKLLGRLTFDPLTFARAEPREQDRILRRLVGVDTTELDGQQRDAAARRTELNRRYRTATERVKLLPVYSGAPAEETPLTEVSQEMLRAEELRKEANEAIRHMERATEQLTFIRQNADKHLTRITELKELLGREELLHEQSLVIVRDHEDALMTHKRIAAEAESAVPNVSAIRQRLTDLDDANKKVRANREHRRADDERLALGEAAEKESATIKAIGEQKQALLTAARFPVSGLGFGDNGVTFNGVPFEQASTAEQLRVSVAIGLALNPTLKVLLVRDGNALDVASLKAVAEQVEAADAQVWLERVSETKDGSVAVMIEDGHLA